jgi:hypothetical protein
VRRLHPVTLGDMLIIVPRVYRRAAPVLLGLAAVFLLPVYVVLAVIQVSMLSTVLELSLQPAGLFTAADLQQLLGTVLVSILVGFIVGLLAVVAAGAFVRASARMYLEGHASFRDAAATAVQRSISLVGATFLSALAMLAVIFVGLLAIALLLGVLARGTVASQGGPAVFVAFVIGVALFVAVVTISVRWSFVGPAIMVEGLGAMAALGRSWRLTAGSIWRTFGIVLIFGLLVALFQAVIAQVLTLMTGQVLGIASFEALLISTAAGSLVSLPFAPVVPLALTVLYFDLRVRREAFDVLPAQPPGEPPVGPPAG